MNGNRHLRAWMGCLCFCLLVLFLTSACRAQVAQAPEEPALTPSRAATPIDVEPTLKTDAPTSIAPGEEIASPSPSPPADPASSPADAAEHTVQPGDTLLGIASTYGVPMAAIQLQNDMGSSTVVQVGQTLAIPSREAWAGASRFWIVHVVAPGETLSNIARAYGLTAQAIQQTNGLTDADLIVAGRELVIPLESPSVTQTPAPPATATSPPEPSATQILTATVSAVPTIITETVAATTTPEPTSVSVSPPPDDVSAWPRETARLINVVRKQHGLPPLTYNETLAQAAQGQANDCAERGWCSHTGSDGSNIKARVLRAGYDAASWAECWAQRQTPQGAVDIWMDEVPPNDPHRRTLLTTWLSEIGVGIAKTDWGYYFIANFGRPN